MRDVAIAGAALLVILILWVLFGSGIAAHFPDLDL